MAKWKYTLKTGKRLRQAVESENYEKILNAISDCFEEINSKFPERYSNEELENDFEEIENLRDNLENYEDYDMDFEEVIDSIDYYLNELYDLCDNLLIWIDI